ncbi:MAG: hypothetical protein CL878_09690 [Dehalococcoidia bacterium]|nr:hypothetical protein [Dehalococcoidia bacterium]
MLTSAQTLWPTCPVGYHQVVQFTVEIDNQQWEIEVEPGVPPAVQVDGEAVPATLHSVGRSALYTLLIGRQSYEVAITQLPSGELAVLVDSHLATVRVEDPLTAALRAASDRPATTLGELTILAPMPGRVVSVEVRTGQQVTAGATLVIIEAMKMESSITAPHDGTVEQVVVQPGQTVSRDDELVVLDAGSAATAPDDEAATP